MSTSLFVNCIIYVQYREVDVFYLSNVYSSQWSHNTKADAFSNKLHGVCNIMWNIIPYTIMHSGFTLLKGILFQYKYLKNHL